MNLKSKLIGYLLLGLLSSTAHAWISSSSGMGSSGSSSSFKFKAMGDLTLQRASFGSKDNEQVEKRALNGVGLNVVAGFNYSFLFAGVGAEGVRYVQQADPEDYEDTNLGGTLLSYSAVGGLVAGNFLLLGKYYFKSEFSLSNKTRSGDEVAYSGPDGSFGVTLLWRPKGKTYLSLNYTTMVFSKLTQGGEDSTFSDDAQMELTSFGLSYGIMF